MSADTAPVRVGEELDKAALRTYLTGRIAGVEAGLEIEQFPGGHSNLTYLIRTGGEEYVLRRAPLGPLPPKAHDMARECRVLQAVSPHFKPAPKAYLLCEDPAVIGATFFLMERRRGLILRTSLPDDVRSQPGYQTRISEAFLNCLAELHAVNVERHSLGSLGKPKGFVERQVRGWADRWKKAETEPAPEVDRVVTWLSSNIPASAKPTLVHNDYKLDNVMFAAGAIDRVEAVLDWEMATVGDPMIDVGLTLCYWTAASSPEVSGGGVPGFTSEPGWYTRDQFLQAYSLKTGRDLVGLQFHEVLGIFKLAVILQQIYFRYVRGQTNDTRFAGFGGRVKALSAMAAAKIG